MGRIELLNGDCLELLKTLDENSIDSIVTDPPYELGFMGKAWDKTGIAFRPAVWLECLRVLKPGGHLLAFGGSRTFHRIAVAIEDAGFEIRDTIMWIYGSGFPKSHNISIAIDKLAGAEREVTYIVYQYSGESRSCMNGDFSGNRIVTAPATPAAAQFAGFGTALKPAHEPIILARKPLQGTVAENVLQWGTGGLNIDACRVATNDSLDGGGYISQVSAGWDRPYRNDPERREMLIERKNDKVATAQSLGRWPANIIHDGSAEVVAGFPETNSSSGVIPTLGRSGGILGKRVPRHDAGKTMGFNDTGSAARFFYCAKASKADRDEGLEGFDFRQTIGGGGTNDPNGDDVCGKYGSVKSLSRNHHPTVKPTSLMKYLCRLVTPPGGLVLDPFMGSGSTGKAAILEGFRFVGIEREAEYLEIARARINHVAGVKNEPEEPENKPAAISKPQQAKLF